MANTQGVAYVFGSPATITLFTAADSSTTIFTGTSSTANEGFDISHECDTEEVKNTSGEVVGHVVSNNRLSLTVNCIPSGSTVADALLTSFLADGNGTAVITGAKVVTCGGVANAINTGGSPASGRWIYAGGGSVKFTNSGKAMVTLPLKKYPSITALSAIAL
jgi:hypothetical protein